MKDSKGKRQEFLRDSIAKIIENNWYLYLLEIDYKRKEIMFCVTEKLLWNLIPTNPEHFEIILNDFPGYTLIEMDEKYAKYNGDRNSILSEN